MTYKSYCKLHMSIYGKLLGTGYFYYTEYCFPIGRLSSELIRWLKSYPQLSWRRSLHANFQSNWGCEWCIPFTAGADIFRHTQLWIIPPLFWAITGVFKHIRQSVQSSLQYCHVPPISEWNCTAAVPSNSALYRSSSTQCVNVYDNRVLRMQYSDHNS